MPTYTRLYADCRQSSLIQCTTTAKGEKAWFTQTGDIFNKNRPRLILVTENGLAVQYNTWFQFMSMEGKMLWKRDCKGGLSLCYEKGLFYYRITDLSAAAVDMDNKAVIPKVYIFSSSPLGWYPQFKPLDQGKYLVQTFNRPRNDFPGSKPKNNVTNCIVTNGAKWDWLQKFEGDAQPALLTKDGKKIVLVNNSSKMMIIELSSGVIIDTIDLHAFHIYRSSLDSDDRLIVSLLTVKQRHLLCALDLKPQEPKMPLWSCDLPVPSDRPFAQPPSIGTGNRIYYTVNNQLYAIEEGKILWNAPVFPSRYFQYVTVLDDNSILIASANCLRHLHQDGNELIKIFLAPGEDISTPPVIDRNGRIYFGTAAGIYCFH